MWRGSIVVLALVSSAGCGPHFEGDCSADLLGDPEGVGQLARPEPTKQLRVMTQNLYLGAEISASLAIPLEQIPAAVAAALQQIQATNFPLRARAIALEIKAASPHLVGLQEAELIRVQSPGDSLGSNPTPATVVAADYLEILLGELQRLGLCYQTAVVGVQTDLELPAAAPGAPGYQDVRLTDRDVLLARCDVRLANAVSHHFLHKLVVPVGGLGGPGPTVEILRGWQEVDATIGQRRFHVVNTHLEPATLPEIALIQVAQAGELIAALVDEPLPVVLLGDFNSAADHSTTATYGLMLHAGFADAWRLARDGEPGYTCCQAPDLSNDVSLLSKRIDFVFVRDFYDVWLGWLQGGVSAFRVSDRVLPGFDLWPSDHAGVVASLPIFARPLLSRLQPEGCEPGRGPGRGPHLVERPEAR